MADRFEVQGGIDFPFTITPSDALRYPRRLGLNPSESQIILTLHLWADIPAKKLTVFPSFTKLAEYINLSWQQIKRVMRGLRLRGLIRVINRPGANNIIDLKPFYEAIEKIKKEEEAQKNFTRCVDAPGGVRTCTGSNNNIDYPYKNNNVSGKTESENSEQPLPTELCPSDLGEKEKPKASRFTRRPQKRNKHRGYSEAVEKLVGNERIERIATDFPLFSRFLRGTTSVAPGHETIAIEEAIRLALRQAGVRSSIISIWFRMYTPWRLIEVFESCERRPAPANGERPQAAGWIRSALEKNWDVNTARKSRSALI